MTVDRTITMQSVANNLESAKQHLANAEHAMQNILMDKPHVSLLSAREDAKAAVSLLLWSLPAIGQLLGRLESTPPNEDVMKAKSLQEAAAAKAARHAAARAER